MNCLVTGAAGFIGSHLVEALLGEGHRVIGVDCFSDFYAPGLKEANLAAVLGHPRFTLHRRDLLELDLPALLGEAEVVFHLAAQAGVRSSWGREFSVYTHQNVLATQRLLEAARGRPLRKFVFASSSAVYGDSELPMREESPTRPLSPYGVTKLAAEHLCRLYWVAHGVPVLSLRYFTVFGPRQRPDMAFHRFLRALLDGRPITLYGDGRQTRDFTYVSDIVEATRRAAWGEAVGELVNVAGGARVELLAVIRELEALTGRRAAIETRPAPAGEMPHTYADIAKARGLLGYEPKMGLLDGLREELAWLEALRAQGGVPDA
ncbi:MAG: GDP-mannose 4,6-dehydratase [Candidatus Rokubacteria bacterium]|nr:GDP-mannose 4,6-dehydratase [Candidatus Rokubacteria bacterium]